MTAFESYYEEHWGEAVRLAHLLSGSALIAEDLAQEALLAVGRRWDEVDNADAYTRRVLVNLSATHHRQQRSAGWEAEEPRIVLPPELDETWVAIKGLGPEHRAVVVLRFYADETIETIAEILCCPIGTVKSRLHRALAQLREELP